MITKERIKNLHDCYLDIEYSEKILEILRKRLTETDTRLYDTERMTWIEKKAGFIEIDIDTIGAIEISTKLAIKVITEHIEELKIEAKHIEQDIRQFIG